MNDTPFIPTPEAVVAMIEARAKEDAAYRNDLLIKQYQLGFSNWTLNYRRGFEPPYSYPSVPKAFEVVSVDGWPTVMQGDSPVCEALPVPALPPSTVLVPSSSDLQEAYIASGHRPMAAGETPGYPPVGTTTVDGDGKTWKKTLVGVTPWGEAVEWVRQ